MEELYTQWRDSLKSEQRKRTYRHFDMPLDLDSKQDFKRTVGVLKSIGAHQFLPLVKFTKKDIRYRRKNGVVQRSRKERPIMYASHLDAHIYSFFANQWMKLYEDFLRINNISDVVTAYRRIIKGRGDDGSGKNNISFAKEVFAYIQSMGECSVITADISKFFDTLNHRILREQIISILGRRLSDDEYKVLRSLTSFRYIINDRKKKKGASAYARFSLQVKNYSRRNNCSLVQAVYESGRGGMIKENKSTIGIPQGSPLSGLLANIYMAAFDLEFTKNFPYALYRRYSDDIVIVCPTAKAEIIFLILAEAIEKYALRINPSKVSKAIFKKDSDGALVCSEVVNGNGEALGKNVIDYLGFEFDGKAICIRERTLKKSQRKADKKIKKFFSRQTENNPCKKLDVDSFVAKRKNNAYMKNAKMAMETIGLGISNQQRKFFAFIRKKKSGYRK
jgi:hypothetical protein